MTVSELQIGDVVESELVIFTVGKIYPNGFVEMDSDKPHKVKDETNPMSKCLGTGRFVVDVRCLHMWI